MDLTRTTRFAKFLRAAIAVRSKAVTEVIVEWRCAATISLGSSERGWIQKGTGGGVRSSAGVRQQYAAKSMVLEVEPVN